MSISVSAIKTQYLALGLLVTATTNARDTIDGLGMRPTFGDIIATDPEYDDVVTAQATYDADLLSARTIFNSAVLAQKVQELAVLNILPKNQWVKLTGLTTWSPITTQWVGWPKPSDTNVPGLDGVPGTLLYSIFTIRVDPTTNYFPNI